MRKKLMEQNCPREWNVRALTEDDFWTYCDDARIIVKETPLERLGLHFKRRGQNVIFVRQELRGAERMFVLWHELAHFWLHPPGIQFFQGYNDQIEREADAVAACAMIPQTVLRHYWPSEIIGLYGYPADLVRFRQDLFDTWQL